MRLALLISVATMMLPVAAQARATEADRAFLLQDIQGGRYELALAKLGVAKASKPAIRAFAQMVVRDHMTANAALARLAGSEGVVAPAGMKAADEQRLTTIRALKGTAFDQAFVEEQKRINTEDQQDADKEKASTADPAIKAYIARFAAMDAKHKRMAESLKP